MNYYEYNNMEVLIVSSYYVYIYIIFSHKRICRDEHLILK